MKISIITVTHNSESTILSALESLNEQSFRNVEHIIIDGASTDDTLEIVHENSTSRTLIISEPDDGIYSALNKGLRLATGDIIGLLHSDDAYYDSSTLQHIITTICYAKADFVYGDLVFCSNKKLRLFNRMWKSSSYNASMLFKGWMPPHPTLFVKREVVNLVGMYDERYKISADYDFIIRLCLQKGVKGIYTEQPIVKMSVGGASGNAPLKFCQKSLEDYKIIKRNKLGGLWCLLLKKLRKLTQLSLRLI
jgi:glycosyltransferase